MSAGRFRRDLYYRIAPFRSTCRRCATGAVDIPAIAARILMQVNQSFGRQIPGFAPATLAAMNAYAWPGNVRELQNEIQRMVVLAESDEPLPPRLLSFDRHGAAEAPRALNGEDARPLKDTRRGSRTRRDRGGAAAASRQHQPRRRSAGLVARRLAEQDGPLRSQAGPQR